MTVATLEDAILWDVCVSPDDDLPRLAYADFLEERGNGEDGERARFIRRQMAELDAGMPGTTRPWWLGDPLPFLDMVITGWERGFVSSVGCTLRGWGRHGAAVVARQPVVQVTLSGMRPLRQGQGKSYFFWYRSHFAFNGLPGFYVPAPLWPFLGAPSKWCLRYPSGAHALRALSDACVNYARAGAGLPPYRGGASVGADTQE